MFGHHGHHHGQNPPPAQAPAAAGGSEPTFKLFCKADEGYCLSVRDGNVVLAPTNPRDVNQHWFKDMRFSQKIKDEEGNPAFAIVNKATGLAVKHSLGQGHPVKLVPYNPEYLDESVMWTESGDVGKGFRCIRMVNNTRLNFDALNGDKDHGGVHDGTTVVLWEWAKGDNQSWKILPWGEEAYAAGGGANAPRGGGSSEPTVRIFCKADEGFSATVRNGEVVLAPTNPRDDHQHWFKDMRHSNKIKDEEGYPAFALVNKVTGQAIKHSQGEGHPVKLVPYNPNYQDESVLWTESRDVGAGFRCIRMVNNIYLNFDALNGDKDHGAKPASSPPKRGGAHTRPPCARFSHSPIPPFPSHPPAPPMATPRPAPLLAGPSSSSPAAAAAAPARQVTMRMFHGDVSLGDAEVFPIKPGPDAALPFPTNEIRVSHLSPASERCPPLAILQTIAPFSVRCKLQAKTIPLNPSLHRLYLTCFNEYKSAVVVVGDEELHLVAMPSKAVNVPCFWCCSVRAGLYASSVGMLNLRCLAIVFDLDETLIVANTVASFERRIGDLSHKMEAVDDPGRVAAMSAEIKRYIEDRALLKEFIDKDTVTDNGRILVAQKEEVQPIGAQDRLLRPVIRLPERNAILTRINPEIRDTSVFVKLRPAWEDLRSYLTAKGRKRFEVYVCTMAERDYALEIWRLLDPEANLISLNNISERVVCVKPDSSKSLQHVFKNGGCHPKMAMVIDDRLKVWDEKDQPRVHVVPAYAPYYAPQAETANAVPVLCVARNVACNIRGGFFREFDENLLKKVFELLYENELLDLPYAPDVGDYLVCEDTVPTNKDPAPIPEGMSGAEVEKRLNGRAHQVDQKQISSSTPIPEGMSGAEVEKRLNGRAHQVDHKQISSSTRLSDDMRVAPRGNLASSNVESNGGSLPITPLLFVSVLQEIGRLCNSKVEFRSTVSSTGKSTQFSVEVLFSNEKVGSGTGKTREEAQVQAAEKALQNLQSNYLSFVAPMAGVLNKDTSKSPGGGNGFLEDDIDADGDTSMKELSGSTPIVDRLSSVISLLRELCVEDQHVVFRDEVQNPGSAINEEYHFQVELAGQILGIGIGANRDFAKLQAAEEALRFLETTTDPQIKKHLRPIRCS